MDFSGYECRDSKYVLSTKTLICGYVEDWLSKYLIMARKLSQSAQFFEILSCGNPDNGCNIIATTKRKRNKNVIL